MSLPFLEQDELLRGKYCSFLCEIPTYKAANEIEENRRNLMGKEHDAMKMFQVK
jgi:hypothetical protein